MASGGQDAPDVDQLSNLMGGMHIDVMDEEDNYVYVFLTIYCNKILVELEKIK